MPYSQVPTAVMNEQTAAYTVVPALVALLETTFSRVIIINFWSTREGTGKAASGLLGRSMKVIAVYSRRPKTTDKVPGKLFIKLNQQLFDRAAELSKNGIPVFAAAPKAQSLWDLKRTTECCYFAIMPGQSEQIVELDVEHYEVKEPVITPGELLASVVQKAEAMDYGSVISAIKKSNSQSHSFFMFSRWGQYKPIYFLCLTDAV
jgi:hypothetical protein